MVKVTKPNPIPENIGEYFSYDPVTGIVSRIKKSGKNDVLGPVTHIYSDGYVRCRLMGRKLVCHRVAWFLYYGVQPPEILDHIDRDKTNNRISNLREATASLNTSNSDYCNNSTGFKGVIKAFDKSGRPRYRSVIKSADINRWQGTYDTPEEAHEAYKQASIKYHGEFSPYWSERKQCKTCQGNLEKLDVDECHYCVYAYTRN